MDSGHPTTHRKRINHRQWWHRLIHRKCWNCDVPLDYVMDRDGRVCAICHVFYSETLMVTHERTVRARWWLNPWRAG